MKVDIEWHNDEDTWREPDIHVCIEGPDVWSLDHTLAHILVPALCALQECKHGAPNVDPEDVPEELRPPEGYDWSNGCVDDKWFARWDWVMEEMIWLLNKLGMIWMVLHTLSQTKWTTTSLLDKLGMSALTTEHDCLENTTEVCGTDMANRLDRQKHYMAHAIEPIDYIVKNDLDFLEGNIIKYVTRYKLKNGIEDLRKAQVYLRWLIEREQERERQNALQGRSNN